MSDADIEGEVTAKKPKKARERALPSTPEEVETLIRRQKRNMRKAWAEGYMTAITALLRPGDLVLAMGAGAVNGLWERLQRLGERDRPQPLAV